MLEQERLGVIHAVITCNTSHAPEIFNPVQQILKENNSQLILVHVIKETINQLLKLRQNHKIKVGILSTLGTYEIELFTQELKNKSVDYIKLPLNYVKQIHQLIYNIKADLVPSMNNIGSLSRILDYYIDNKVTHVILGCTELPIYIKEKTYQNITFINPMEVVVDKLIDLYKQ